MMPEFTFDFLDLGVGYRIPVCYDEISPRPAGADLTLRLRVEIKFRPGKAEQFSTEHFFRFGVIGVPLVSLLLTLNIFHTLF